jgi:hypothetical protein
MEYKFIGYAPDLDPTTPGVITNCGAFIPSLKGMEGAPSPVSAGYTVLPSACVGAATLTKLDETKRTFAGTISKIFELASDTWTDRSGSTYQAAVDSRWRFAQFGNISLAANKGNIIQSSTSSVFANVGAAVPKAGDIETVGQFVFAFNTNDQGNLLGGGAGVDDPDRWWCCAKGDSTNWSPNAAVECASGRLTSVPGKLVGGKKFGANIVAYKQRGMFLGVYEGGAVVWNFDREIPGGVGALSKEVIVDVGTPDNPRHIFMGFEDFYSFDGSRPVPIGESWVKETVYTELNRTMAGQCWALHDRTKARIYFYYPISDAGNPDKCVVYNYRTGKWGSDDREIEAAFEFQSPSATYADVGDSYATYGDLPSVTYGSAFWTSGYPTPAIFNTSHLLQTLNGVALSPTFTTGDIGDDVNEVLLSRVIPRYLTAPSTASMVNFYRQNLGDTLTQDATTSQSSDKRFDVLREARWHRLRIDFTGDVEIPGLVIEAGASGSE